MNNKIPAYPEFWMVYRYAKNDGLSAGMHDMLFNTKTEALEYANKLALEEPEYDYYVEVF